MRERKVAEWLWAEVEKVKIGAALGDCPTGPPTLPVMIDGRAPWLIRWLCDQVRE